MQKGRLKMSNSRQLARDWPYPRHSKYVSKLKDAAKNWFKVADIFEKNTSANQYLIQKWLFAE